MTASSLGRLRWTWMAGAVALVMSAIAMLSATAASAQDYGRDPAYAEFYETLDPHGEWIEHPRYGQTWAPFANEDREWRPYSRGQWVFTEEHGWLWDSDEPFGWVVYHYGRWILDPYHRWMWVPGTEWGPAWVAWREGEDAVGWMPLPPEAELHGNGFTTFDEMASPRYASMWMFVAPALMTMPAVHRHFFPHQRGSFFYGRTRFSTHYDTRDRRVYNRGIDRRFIEMRAQRPVPVLQVRPLSGPRDARPPRGPDGDRRMVGIYRPQIAPPMGGARGPGPGFGPGFGDGGRRPDFQGRPDGGRPAFGRPDGGRPDLGRPDFGRPDLGRPDAGRPELGRPDLGRPEGGRPEGRRPDGGRPDGQRPDGAGRWPNAPPVAPQPSRVPPQQQPNAPPSAAPAPSPGGAGGPPPGMQPRPDRPSGQPGSWQRPDRGPPQQGPQGAERPPFPGAPPSPGASAPPFARDRPPTSPNAPPSAMPRPPMPESRPPVPPPAAQPRPQPQMQAPPPIAQPPAPPPRPQVQAPPPAPPPNAQQPPPRRPPEKAPPAQQQQPNAPPSK